MTLIGLTEHDRVLVELLEHRHEAEAQGRSNHAVEGVRHLVAPPPAEPDLHEVLRGDLLGLVLLAQHQTRVGMDHAVLVEVIVIILRERLGGDGLGGLDLAHWITLPF